MIHYYAIQKGLVHISQIARDRVENINEVVSAGQEVYVKCMKVEFPNGENARPKISLSMKFADQSSGMDRDPNGIEAELAERSRAYAGGNQQRGPVELGAGKLIHSFFIQSFCLSPVCMY